MTRTSYFDSAEFAQFSPQDPATTTMSPIIGAHDTIMCYSLVTPSLTSVPTFHIVGQAQSYKFYLNQIFDDGLYKILVFRKIVAFNYLSNKIQKWSEEEELETFWTEYPTLIVILLVLPVLSFPSAPEEAETTQWDLIVKVVGNQWSWAYELLLNGGNYSPTSASSSRQNCLAAIPAFKSFESRMISEEDLVPGSLRLLEVDKPLVLPNNIPIHVYVTSADVIHSWAIPSLGVKIDAVPGRLNAISLCLTRQGIFYGQCSESCGVHHYAMPIKIISFNAHFYNEYFPKNLTVNLRAKAWLDVIEKYPIDRTDLKRIFTHSLNELVVKQIYETKPDVKMGIFNYEILKSYPYFDYSKVHAQWKDLMKFIKC